MNRKITRSKRSSRALAALSVILCMSSVSAAPASAMSYHDQGVARETLGKVKEALNKRIVLGLFEALNRKDFGYLTRTVRHDLVQHYPEIANGGTAFRGYHQALREKFPALRFSVKRSLAQGDLVMVHSHFVGKPGDLGVAKANLFRLRDGKIIEHWQVEQAVPPPAEVGNDMFSTLSSPRVARPLPLSPEKTTERVGRAIFAEAINQPDSRLRLKAVKRYIGDNTYFQHFPGVPNGAGPFNQFVHDAFAVQPEYVADVRIVVAEDDLVVLLVHLTKLFDMEDGVAFDILRVRDGKLLEHWSITQPTPATSANPNTMY